VTLADNEQTLIEACFTCELLFMLSLVLVWILVSLIYSCREQYAMHFLAVVWKAGKIVVAIPVSE